MDITGTEINRRRQNMNNFNDSIKLEDLEPNEINIDNLVLRLAKLAYHWRGYHSVGNEYKSNLIVKEYHRTVGILKELGWTGDDLLPDEELPDELMPEI